MGQQGFIKELNVVYKNLYTQLCLIMRGTILYSLHLVVLLNYFISFCCLPEIWVKESRQVRIYTSSTEMAALWPKDAEHWQFRSLFKEDFENLLASCLTPSLPVLSNFSILTALESFFWSLDDLDHDQLYKENCKRFQCYCNLFLNYVQVLSWSVFPITG